MGLSKTMLIGRLTRDPELQYFNSKDGQKAVSRFSVAVDKDYGEGADFYNVSAFGKLGENVANYLSKGRQVYVEGRIEFGSYEKDVSGQKVTIPTVSMIAQKVEFLGSASGNNQSSQSNDSQNYQNNSRYANQDQQQASAPIDIQDDDLPF